MASVKKIFAIIILIILLGVILKAYVDYRNTMDYANKLLDSPKNIASKNMAAADKLSIDSVFEKNGFVAVQVNNIGVRAFSGKGLRVSVDGKLVTYNGCDQVLYPSNTCTLNLGGISFPQKGTAIEISVMSNASSEVKYRCLGTGSAFC